ncbi:MULTISPECIES: hypothetical protein [Erythrobacter]|uniref:Uncharacterized protein n=2 Tax=Erythrobacter TaxID=1041 RepID=A0ABS6SK79_9SPHN|nr:MULTISPECIES: hypothetical protein [Erythrobacter]MBD2842942.1 hypothetical protein [Erythrobacter rubeus]MBV7265281.1 hypothetical protein [Erythrobacter ani]
MTSTLWIGLAGTVLGLAFLINAYRTLRVSIHGHAANAARIHIPVVIMFLPVLWFIVAVKYFSG